MTSPIHLTIAPGDDAPIYRQIVRQVREALAGGRLRPGDRLQSQRELALQLVISPLTVKKAYDELERAGLIMTQRGRGTFVCQTPRFPDTAERHARLRAAAQSLVSQAALSGLSFAELVQLLEEIQKGMES